LRETQIRLQEAHLKISKLEDSNSALKADLKVAREKLRAQAKGEGPLRLALGRLVHIFWWFGQLLPRWGRTIWTSNRWRVSGFVLFIVVLFCVKWRFFYRTNESSRATTKATTTIPSRGEVNSRSVGSFLRGMLSLLLE